MNPLALKNEHAGHGIRDILWPVNILLLLQYLIVILVSITEEFFPTSVLAHDPYRYSPPTGGSSNCPTTVESSATSLAWIKNPRNVGAAAVDSRTTVRNERVCRYNSMNSVHFDTIF